MSISYFQIVIDCVKIIHWLRSLKKNNKTPEIAL